MISSNENVPEFENTKTFIQRRCQKDHFTYLNKLPQKKMHSLYEESYRGSREKQNKRESELVYSQNKAMIQRSQILEKHPRQSSQITPLASRYKLSYSNFQSQPIELGHEKPSFFLKNKNIEELKSEYQAANQKNLLLSQILPNQLEKGKAGSNLLGVPKYNKLAKSSVYRESYRGHPKDVKLPSIHRQNNECEKHRKIL